MLSTPVSSEKILVVAQSLPALPQIMIRLHAMLLDSTSGLADVALLLKRDLALTTRIIRIANSPAYRGKGLASIEEALQRVGFGEVFRLVGVAANARLADSTLSCYGYTARKFGTHNLCTALIAEGISRHLDEESRLAYTAGLLRRIGQLLLDRIGRGELTDAETFPETCGLTQTAWEKQTFGLTHFAVTERVLRQWNFPNEVVAAISHAPTSLKAAPPLARVLQLAETLARVAGYGLDGDEPPQEIPAEQLLAAGLNERDARTISEKAVGSLAVLNVA